MAHPFLPDSYEDLLRRCQALARAGDAEGAIAVCARLVEKLGRLSNDALARRPQLRDMRLRASLQLIELLRSEGRYAEAIGIGESLLQAYPEQAGAWRRDLAILRLAKGEVDRGLAELQALAEEDPENVWHWIVLGNEARIEGRFAESRPAFERALEVAARQGDPKLLAAIHHGRFQLYEAMGQPDDALAAWEEAVSREPAVKDTVREVYTMLTDAGRYTLAADYINRDENKLQAGFQRGLLAHLAGEPDRAKQEWQAVADLDPFQFESGHDCWMESVLRLGDPVPVLDRMQQLLRRHGTVRLLVLSGIALAMHGEREPAQKLFEQSIGLLRRGRPPKQKLDGADWRLLQSLVTDREMRAALRPYFAVVESVWD